MGDILYLRDYKTKAEREMEAAQAEQARYEHEVCQVAFEGGPVIEIPMSEVDRYFAQGEKPTAFDPPADCPA